MPVTIPVLPIVATDGVPELHVPPGVASVNVIVEPWHTEDSPPIAAGKGFTVTVTLLLQPVVPSV